MLLHKPPETQKGQKFEIYQQILNDKAANKQGSHTVPIFWNHRHDNIRSTKWEAAHTIFIKGKHIFIGILLTKMKRNIVLWSKGSVPHYSCSS